MNWGLKHPVAFHTGSFKPFHGSGSNRGFLGKVYEPWILLNDFWIDPSGWMVFHDSLEAMQFGEVVQSTGGNFRQIKKAGKMVVESLKAWLGGGLWQIFYFHPDLWGDDPIWRAFFWIGLKPPNSWGVATNFCPRLRSMLIVGNLVMLHIHLNKRA